MERPRRLYRAIFSALAAISLSASVAQADVIPIGVGAFPGGSALLTFNGLPDNLEVNGLVFGGVQFTYSLGSNQLIIDTGPGTTNNIQPLNIVTANGGNSAGVLTLVLPGLQNIFGFGYAILSAGSVVNATTVTLFSGATNLGALSYNGVPDPSFTGGFAGIQSTIRFDRVQLTFNSVTASAFAVDNIRFADTTSTVPEPNALVLTITGLISLALIRPRRSAPR
jgi:hypothetical protein